MIQIVSAFTKSRPPIALQPETLNPESTKMPRSDEAEWWFNAVYEAVQEVPAGRVTSYGHIARLLGKRINSQAP